MKYVIHILFIVTVFTANGQIGKQRVPSYFGLVVRPVFPTQFIGSSTTELNDGFFETTLQQRLGYGFGATVRAGLTKLLALETGINFTQRHFDLSSSVPDSNSFIRDTLTFIEYDIPLNALFYVQLSERFYANVALGGTITYKPTDIATLNQPGGPHTFTHAGVTRRKVGFDLNANLGFEFRTEKSGFFYLGGSARVPFAPLFDLLAVWKYQGVGREAVGEVDGSFLSIDFKYFFPNIRNKGTQFRDGPIE